MAARAARAGMNVEVVSAEAQIDGARFAAERTVPLELGHDEGAILSEIYEHALVESVEYRDKVVVVKFRASAQEHHSIDRLLGRAVR